MGARTFTTILCWQEGEEDREACVKVSYDYSAGYAGEITAIERTDPGEPIDFDRWQNDASLIEECFENEVDEREAAAEYRAEQRRDDLMMDWFA
jgi:hypothetical protein